MEAIYNCGETPLERSAPEPFQAIVAEAEEGVVIVGPNGVVVYANPAAEFLLGHDSSMLIGESFDLSRTVSDTATRVNVISRDGRVRLVELRVEPLPSGSSGSVVIRLKDITAYHEDVASAREQVRRRDEFLAMLSHEIRNPLAAIRNSVLLLSREDMDAEIRRTAGEICDRQFHHLDRILADLLDLARISQGKLQIFKERIELNQVIRDAVEEVAALISNRGHQLHVEAPRKPLWVEGDVTRLGQVVVNLLKNAAKFTPPGGKLSVIMTAGQGSAEIHVKDNGPGIAEDLLPRLFQPFVQGTQTLARSDGGLGIGLALVRNMVELHRGLIGVAANQDGPGVTFTVQLPLVAAGPKQAASTESQPARPLRILLVEDGDDTRRTLKRLLQLDGHDVIEAADGPGGLAALLEQGPDVALLDIGLPGLDGYEVARQAREDPRGRQVRLIAVTGYGMPHDIEAANQAGFDGHLIKPLRYPDLCKLLRECGIGV